MSKMSELHLQLQEAGQLEPDETGYNFQCYLQYLEEQEQKEKQLKQNKNEQREENKMATIG